MNFQELVLKRRSIRNFTSKNIGKEEIEILLKSAMYAPSAVNKQPWHFIVINDKAIFRQIMEVHPHSKMFETANIGILVCGDLKLQHGDGYWLADCGAATQNLLLAATDLGIGSCWIGIYPREDRMKAMKEIFSLPEHVEGFALIALGYPAEEKKTPERYHAEKVFLNRWGKEDKR